MTSSQAELARLLDAQVCQQARNSLLHFMIYIKPYYEPNWHHRLLCHKLDKFVRGETKRLMVFMPPQHGKSELVSRGLPAQILGKYPDAGIIATSYGATLASAMNRDVQRIIDTEEYQRIFPDTRLGLTNVRADARGSYLRNSNEFEVVDHRGHYISAGVGGGITGQGLNYGIIDDPIKNQEEAYSITYRDKCWDWYRSTLFSRLRGIDAGILLTLTRWHLDDIGGRLLKLAAEDPKADQWEVLSIPAVCEEPGAVEGDPREAGEALWPARFPLELLDTHKAQGSYFFNALYQQRPSPPDGGIVKDGWLQICEHLPPPDPSDVWIQSWDATFKETRKGSFVCGQVWCRKGARFYLVDQVRKRMGFPETVKAIKDLKRQYPQCTAIYIEDKANGSAIIDTLKDKILGINPIKPTGSKEARLHAVTPFMEAGNVWLVRGLWTKDYVGEMLAFPNSPFEDQVDTTSQALTKLYRKQVGTMNINLSQGLRTSDERLY